MHHSSALKSNRAKPAGFLSMLLGHVIYHICYNIMTTLVITIVTTYVSRKFLFLLISFQMKTTHLSHYLQLMAAEF